MGCLVEIIAVILAGGAGAIARFGLDRRLKSARIGMSALTSLTVINVIGSIVLGLLLGIAYIYSGATPLSSHGEAIAGTRANTGFLSAWMIPMLGIGFCGGFTTFSTAIVEALPPRLRSHDGPVTEHGASTKNPSPWAGFGQLLVMTAGCVVAALLGYVVALLLFAP